MINPDNTRNPDIVHLSGGNSQWQNTVNLLKLMQIDYQRTRKQLEQISLELSAKETLLNQQIHHALLTSQGYRTLCLSGKNSGAAAGSMGSIVLGEVIRPAVVPQLVKIEVRCLGRFEVTSIVGQVDHWHSAKARSVFQYLLINPHEPVTKEALMEALWPDCSPQAAGNNLKAAIHSLRVTLNDLLAEKDNTQQVLFQQGSYLINPDINLWTDVEAFEKAWITGRRLEKEGRIDEAIREYEKAEDLYAGDYLSDESYEDWTLLRREALRDTYLIILGKLADRSIQIADYESGIHYSQKILAKDHCREDAYRRLMYCYAKLGQKNRALRWYEICRQTNKVELDISPDSATAELYNAILQDCSL